MAATARGEVKLDKTACEALKHPIRVRILEVPCEGEISPVQFLYQGMLPPGVKIDDTQNAISTVSYHFKVLMKAGCISLVETRQRRGATEHIYRSNALAFHTDEEFAAMSFEERRAISRSTLQTLIARADGALSSGTFDNRPDRHLSWLSMELDEEAWSEIRDLQAETLERAQQIKAAAAARNLERTERDESPVAFPATFGALSFESPPTTYLQKSS